MHPLNILKELPNGGWVVVVGAVPIKFFGDNCLKVLAD